VGGRWERKGGGGEEEKGRRSREIEVMSRGMI
jgi:hypothetical protein